MPNSIKKAGLILTLPLGCLLLSCTDDIDNVSNSSSTVNNNKSAYAAESLTPLNDVMMQAFYWNVPVDEASLNGTWWDNLRQKAPQLKQAGFASIWTPVPAKGNWGIVDNGYGIFDHYDLGNYNQKGSVETRFGSRAELEAMIAEMHQQPKISVYSDVVLNHVYSSDENEEINPAVKAYIFGEAGNGAYMPFPASEVRWVITNAQPGDYYIQVKGYGLPWTDASTERGYDLSLRWDDSDFSSNYAWEYEPNDGNGNSNTFLASGANMRGHIDNAADIDEYKITLTSAHDIEMRLSARRETGSPMQWVDAGSMLGYYPVAVWYNGQNLATSTLEARTNTHIAYPQHTGQGEANYEWNYTNFHPVDANDWLGGYGSDEIVTNTKFFGNDFNTFSTQVQERLGNWGSWLVSQIGFDGFRLDFVRGFQEAFVANWVGALPQVDGQQPFIVGEYWGSDYRIKNWVSTVASLGANVHAFDFPLKNTLTDLCNKNGTNFNMTWLNHAGLVRNSYGNSVDANNVVTFIENHDTGKEHDKWITRDMHLGYAYILTHEGTPCVFYPHFFGDVMTDADNSQYTITPPQWLGESISQLINIRKTYLGGGLVVLSEVGNPYPSANVQNLYIARRQGNGDKDGAIVVINNNDSQSKAMWVTVNANGFSDWAGQTLVNVLNTSERVTVEADGRVELSAPARSYTIWVKLTDLE